MSDAEEGLIQQVGGPLFDKPASTIPKSKVVLMHGHDHGIDFHVGFIPEEGAKKDLQHVTFELHSAQRIAEFHELMTRALNCMEKPPEWAMDYMDFVTGTPTPPPPKEGVPHPNNAALFAPSPVNPNSIKSDAEVFVPYCQLDEPAPAYRTCGKGIFCPDFPGLCECAKEGKA